MALLPLYMLHQFLTEEVSGGSTQVAGVGVGGMGTLA